MKKNITLKKNKLILEIEVKVRNKAIEELFI